MAIPYSSSYDETIPFSDTTFRLVLTVGVVQTVTIPGTKSQKFSLLFGLSSNANVYVGYNATPSVPAANTTISDSNVEFITPDSKRYAIGGDVISFVSADATANIGMSVRQIPN